MTLWYKKSVREFYPKVIYNSPQAGGGGSWRRTRFGRKELNSPAAQCTVAWRQRARKLASAPLQQAQGEGLFKMINEAYDPADELPMVSDSKPSTNSSANDENDVRSVGEVSRISKDEHIYVPRDAETLLFRDSKRWIDMVLVFEDDGDGDLSPAGAILRARRKVFEESLLKEGLELESEDKENSFDGKKCFLKIHVPSNVLTRYAAVMNMKTPAKRFLTLSSKAWGHNLPNQEDGNSNSFPYKMSKIFDYDSTKISKEPSFYETLNIDSNEEQFVIKERESTFTSAQRSQIVWQIMMRAKYDDGEKVGIRRLLNNQTYLAAYPLHEGRYDKDTEGFILDRRLLYLEWARASKFYKKQPLWLVRKYFGDKIGLYFAWLGFYTAMLIPSSIVGLLCFLYGLASLHSSDNIPSKEICNSSGPGNITMCPLCDSVCDYIKLGDSCTFAQMTYLFDNPATVFFAIFMSFWATTFLELWKRRQAVIVWEWDLQHVEEEEEPRPEFEETVKTYRTNPVTLEKEPYLPTWSKAWRFFATSSAVFFMVTVVLGAVLGTIIYRISVVSVIYGTGDYFLQNHAKIFTSVTAAVMNLIIIMILTKLYQKLALWLTNVENPRTQIEYEDSYTFKIFVFQFVNFYSSLIYIAFFKGRFFKHPGDKAARSSALLQLKMDVCDPAGCLSELCIQLAIIMVGKQFFNNFLEVFLPKMWNWWNKRTHRSKTKDFNRKYSCWEEDFQLVDAGRLALFEEYLEMVLQYGFVTLFVAAFPLAPLFALLNNIGEVRIDAYKMVTQARRPLAERVQDIGAWYGILQGVTYAAVVSNAFVIAYTSDFIPRMVYTYEYSPTGDLRGYIDFSLSDFNTSDYGSGLNGTTSHHPRCQYRGYRRNYTDPMKYELSPVYWHVFAARLAFVVVFEHLVFALTGIMAYVIPDVPSEVRTQIQREKMLANEAKYERGLKDGGASGDAQDLVGRIRGSSVSWGGRTWWGRRLSRVSDSSAPPDRDNSALWERHEIH
ncbi:anoctamin-4 [Bacillus rossius redtenbacheri]|uniref:anoctamin-4 n=1 Tax=Bacillus rossius redtenbacheri TaxID=93214 RepID=UPI002FDE47B1